MDFDTIRKNGDLLFESIRGSHLFGLNTETSDVDTFGVFCGPEEWFLGSGKDMTSIVKSEKSDDYWDELGKYFFELGKSNPEALVSLFTPEKFILHFDPVLQPLWDIKDQLLTKECFKSFSGYAYSQIKKAKGLKKAINTDPDEVKERKNPLYFCQVPVGIGTHTLKKWLGDRGLRQECCGISRLPNSNECYALFYDWGKAKELGDVVEIDNPTIGYRGILSPDDPLTSQLRLSSIPKEEEPLCWFQFNSNAYTSHCVEYKRYWDWVKNRNVARFELNKGHNYDCYDESTTKFLTPKGWKWYHEVEDSDQVACFDKNGELRFSPIISRTKYIGDDIDIYTYSDKINGIEFNVTENHRLWLRRKDKSDYELITVEKYLKEKDDFDFYQLSSIINNTEDTQLLTDDEIRFCAAFIYSGGISYSSKYSTSREHEAFIVDARAGEKYINPLLQNKLSFQVLPQYIEKSNLNNKKLWDYIINILELSLANPFKDAMFKFSTRQLKVFLDTLSDLSSKRLWKIRSGIEISHPSTTFGRNFMSFLMSLCKIHGFNTRYTEDSYFSMLYLYIKDNGVREILLDPNNFTKNEIKVSSVVCFETETGTLVTSGYSEYFNDFTGLGFHGNSKNISHCVRIFTMAKEIAEGKGMLLDRTGIDKEFLMSVKNHERSYDEIMSYVENLKEEMEESFEKSTLPDCPDQDLLDKLLIDIRRKHYGRTK